jgi:hypothetical protein
VYVVAIFVFKDQKILDLMKQKREEEQRQLTESQRTRQLWEDEKKRQEALRTVMENKRRKMLAQQDHIKNTEKVTQLFLIKRLFSDKFISNILQQACRNV